MRAPVEELRAEGVRVGAFLAGLGPDDWTRDTRCPPMRVHELAAHALRGVVRIREMLDQGAVDAEPEKDGATYFRYDPVSIAAGVVQRSFETAKEYPAEDLAARWDEEWREVLARVTSILDEGDPVLPGVFGLIKLSEYLRTRAVEVTVHAMDLRDAFGLQPDPDPGALDVVCGVLAQLLGTDPRDLGMDGVRFALVATGREALDEGERRMLGPLAERIPVLS